MKTKQKNYLFLQLLLGIWLLILSLPYFFSHSEVFFSPFRQTFLRFLCHQELERFLEINGSFSFVCARCMGIYSGLFVVSFFSLYKINKGILLFLFPTIIDKIIEYFFEVKISNSVRFFSGFGFATVAMYFAQKKFWKNENRNKKIY